jgi:hypothetical protein
MDYVKGFIPVRLNGELCTIPGFLPIACTSGSGFVCAFFARRHNRVENFVFEWDCF